MQDDGPVRLIPYGVGALLLGGVGVAFGDFALQWQPVAPTLALRTQLAYVSGALLAAGGAAVLVRNLAGRAALALGVLYAIWTLLLHGPRLVAAPNVVIHWNAFAEIAALAAAGVAGWALCSGRERAGVIARRVFGACFTAFGVAHFVYADFTADMIPTWIPTPLFWAYATGAGHIAASLSLMSGRYMPLAATLLTFMLGSFVLLLHAPRVIAQPASHIEWVMLGVSMSLTGAAWVVRASVIARRPPAAAGALGIGPHSRAEA
jgi:uncharacterized membrane protein